MKKILYSFLGIVISFLCSCTHNTDIEIIKISKELQLTKLSETNYIHTSWITLKNGAKFPCNGFIYIHEQQCYVFDTPVTDQSTSELITWLQQDLDLEIKGVVFNHFHNDCTEGADIFKRLKITTIASSKTKKLMLQKGYPVPDQVFNDQLIINLGTKKIINVFLGEAHTIDNIVSYFPEEHILFGGCMVKGLGAKKGNLADANLTEWPKTIAKVKSAYPDAKTIIPGHGEYGDQSLLDYTISLFTH